jgi:hypothetical protein
VPLKIQRKTASRLLVQVLDLPVFGSQRIRLPTPELFVAARKRYERRARFAQTVAAGGDRGSFKSNETALRFLLVQALALRVSGSMQI